VSRRTIKKLLLSLIAVGVLASFTARGTFAIFNTETTNPANSLATGTNTTLTAVNPCCPGTSSGVVPVAPNPTCSTGSLDLYLQETNAPSGSPRTYTNLSSCLWPASTSASCTFANDSFESFWSSFNPQTSALSLGSIAAGATRYFQVAVGEPSNALLGLEGQTATFALYWYLQQ